MKKRRSIWMVALGWVVIIFLCSSFMGRKNTVSVEIEDEGMVVWSASGYSCGVVWDEVQNVEVRDAFELGEMVSGTDEEKEKSGVWENREFGQYQLCIDAEISRFIILSTDEEVVVMNYESGDSTDSFYEAIKEKVG